MFESFSIDAYVCDLGHEPTSQQRSYHSGDFVRICIHTVSDNSDLIVTGLEYFIFSNQKTNGDPNAMAVAMRTTPQPKFSCSNDNMCVVETILDYTLFEENDSKKEIYGQGSLIFGRSGSPADGNNIEQETTLEVSVTLPLNDDGSQPNLHGQSKERTKFLRGSQEGV